MFKILLAIAGYSQIFYLNSLDLKRACKNKEVVLLTEQFKSVIVFDESQYDNKDLWQVKWGNKDLGEYFRKHCAFRSLQRESYAAYLETIKKCLTVEQAEMSDKLATVDENLQNALCGKIIDSIKKDEIGLNGVEYDCWNGAARAAHYCHESLINALGYSDYDSLKNYTCSDFEQLQLCMEKQCPYYCNKQATEFLVKAIKIFGDGTCKIYSGTTRTSRPVEPIKPSVEPVTSLHRQRVVGLSDITIVEFQEKLKNLCVYNGYPTDKIDSTLKECEECLKQMYMTSKHQLLEQFDNCTRRTVQLFSTCLPEQYKYMPDIFVNIVKKTFDVFMDNMSIFGSKLTDDLHEVLESKEKFCENWITTNQCSRNSWKKACEPTAN